MLFNTTGSLVYQGCLWLTTVLVVTLSGAYTGSGILAFAMTIGNMFNPIGTYSMRTYQVSDIRCLLSQGNYIAFRLITVCIGLVLIVPYTFAVTPELSTAITVLLYLLFKTDEAFADVLYGADQKGQRMDYIGVSQFVRGVLLLLGFSLGVGVLGNLDAAVLLMLIPCFAVTLFYDLPHARRFGSIRPTIKKSQVLDLLKSCLYLVAGTLCLGAVVSVARQYYGVTFGVDSLGLYAAVATPAVLIQAMARFLYSPVLVPLSERWVAKGTKEFVPYLKRTIVIIASAAIASAVFLSLIGTPALALVYGQSVADYTYLFPYVLAGTCLIAFIWYLSDVLIICRDFRGVALCSVGALAVSLAAMVPLENLFGMNGINFVVIVAMLAGLAIATLRLYRAIRQAQAKEN